MAWRAFQGANGWYVAFERDDGFHHQPTLDRALTETEAERLAARRNREADRDDALVHQR